MITEVPEFVTGVEIFKDRKYKYPNFQRAYSWETEQIDTFLDDLLTKSLKNDYYLGTIYYIKGSNEVIHIIDGQQRITTLFLLINAIRMVNEKKYLTLNIKMIDENNEAIFDSASATPFSRILFSGTIVEIERQFRRENSINLTKMQMLINQKYINKKVEDNVHFYTNNIKKILNNIKFLFLNCEDLATSSTIFENINSKGLKLNNTDIIKNAYFSRIDTLESTDDFESRKYNLWLSIENHIFNKDNLHSLDLDSSYVKQKTTKFKSNLESIFVIYYQLKYNSKYVKTNYNLANTYIYNMEKIKIDTSDALLLELSEINDLAKASKYIFNSNETVPGVEVNNIQRVFNFFDLLGIKVHYPLSIAVYYNILIKNKFKQELQQLEKIFEKLALFHFIYNSVSSSLPSKPEKAYMRIASNLYLNQLSYNELEKEIVDNFFSNNYNFNEIEIYNKFDHMLFTLDRKKEIKKSIDNVTMKEYKMFDSSNEIKYIYELLEKKLRDDHSHSIAIESVEHINNFNEMNIDYKSFKVGNLLPLEKELNKLCENQKVQEKILYYKQSRYMLVKEFVNIYEKNNSNWYEEWLKYLSHLFIVAITDKK